jgi:hypothetical protein
LANQIRKLVVSGGATIFENCGNGLGAIRSKARGRAAYPQSQLPSTLLLANKPHRTLKYLLALAAGIPTIHYNWLIHSHEQRCLLPYRAYLLPAGFSLEKERDVYITKPKTEIFNGLRVEVVGPSEFKDLWGLVLREGGAKVVKRLYTPQEKRIECIVSDPDPTAYLATKFEELQIPVVSKEWIIQSLLSQKMLPLDDPNFHYTAS